MTRPNPPPLSTALLSAGPPCGECPNEPDDGPDPLDDEPEPADDE